jgi:hypothetical protein
MVVLATFLRDDTKKKGAKQGRAALRDSYNPLRQAEK